MFKRSLSVRFARLSLLAGAAMCVGFLSSRASAQIVTGNVNRVGGVSIDTSGLVKEVEKTAKAALRDELKKLYPAAPTELAEGTQLRMVSLKRLETLVRESGTSIAEDMPAEVRFLGGLQRIQYVLVYPEENDIVLAGPGEGWVVTEDGDIVGKTTKRPVLRLEDLLVALRTVDNARHGGISCSIDPTAEGRQRLDALLAKGGTYSSGLLDQIKRALGKQKITLTGVPAESHFARVLVSSDYHMKRIAMRLEPTPLKELPSFIDMLKKENTALDNMMPRWWMAMSGDRVAASEDGLAYELPAQRVQCFTEDEIAAAGGQVSGTGKANPVAQRWADAMTRHFDELSASEPAFGELRNLMDMCVVGALLAKEQLLAKAGCDLPTLMSASSPVNVRSANAPKYVETMTSSLRRGQEYIVTASGGVQIASWQAVEKLEPRPALAKTRLAAQPAGQGRAWWNVNR